LWGGGGGGGEDGVLGLRPIDTYILHCLLKSQLSMPHPPTPTPPKQPKNPH
jgi:hypothetical protein